MILVDFIEPFREVWLGDLLEEDVGDIGSMIDVLGNETELLCKVLERGE